MKTLKTLKMVIVAVAVSAVALLTGCDTNETTLLMAANTAGNIGISAWFAIDDPGDAVKGVLKEVVPVVETASEKIGGGGSYVEALTPVVQEIIAKHEELTAAQKNLINVGSSVILSGLDTFIDSNPDVKQNAELASKVVSAFCRGCMTAIDRSSECCSAQSIKKAHKAIKMRYDTKSKAFIEK